MSLKNAFRVVLSQGQKVVVEFEGTDGQIEVDYDSRGDSKLEVTADMPDSSGREGVIYCEDFSSPPATDFSPHPTEEAPEPLPEYVKAIRDAFSKD